MPPKGKKGGGGGSKKADKHFQGLSQASRHFGRRLSQRQARRLRHLDAAFHVLRHVTQPGCDTFYDEIYTLLHRLPDQAPEPTSSTSSAKPEYFVISSDDASTGDDIGSVVPLSTTSSSQTTLDMCNAVVMDDPDLLVQRSVLNACARLADTLRPRMAELRDLFVAALEPRPLSPSADARSPQLIPTTISVVDVDFLPLRGWTPPNISEHIDILAAPAASWKAIAAPPPPLAR